MIDNDFDSLWWFWWLWCDCYDGCDCDDELLCRRLRKTMMVTMMIYVCVHRYKYVYVHYQFLSPYWLQHIMIYICSSTIRCIFILKIITHHHHHTPYCSVCHYLPIIISHLISLLPLPSFSSISLCTISYRTVTRLSI